MCFAWISEQTAIISPYTINLSVSMTEAQSVYSAVRTGSLNQTDRVSSLKGYSITRCPLGYVFCSHRIMSPWCTRIEAPGSLEICFAYMIRDRVTLTIQNCLLRWGWFYTFHVKDYCGLGIFFTDSCPTSSIFNVMKHSSRYTCHTIYHWNFQCFGYVFYLRASYLLTYSMEQSPSWEA